METRLLTTPQDLALFSAWQCSLPGGSLWQSLEWKRFQEALGREVRIYVLEEGTQVKASALVVIDRTAFGLSTWNIPRGPVWDLGLRAENVGQLISAIMNDAKGNGALSLYFSPPIPFPRPMSHVPCPSSRHEQPSATRIIDLTLTEEDLLRQMKPKGRYNISVAERHGIRVQESKDTDVFFNLIKKTGHRDNFSTHSERHYQKFLSEIPGSFLLLASNPQGDPIAGLMGVVWGQIGIYYYGASAYVYRALMAPYALQWAAMHHCRAAGCTTYDLLGIAPEGAPVTHPWQGVSAFKEKFGGTVITYPPEQEIVLRPIAHRLLQLKRRLLG